MADQEFAYEKGKDGIRILRCYGVSGKVVVPEKIGILPVTELADYVFVAELEEEPEQGGGLPCICGEGLSELYLPGTVRRLGRYAFYNCRKFWKFSFHSSLASMGAGAFTGCDALSCLAVRREDGPSCLREVLQDLKHLVRVDCYASGAYAGETEGEGMPEYRLAYPEFFEEAVENTPARITFTQTHGMGIQYRNAFRGTQVVFAEYDRLFETGKYNADLTSIIEIAAARLRYPYELEAQAASSYKSWLLGHLREAALHFLGQGSLEDLRWMAEELVETKEQAGILAQAANERADAEALSVLLDASHKRFPAGKRRFSL